ncbi:HEAT repeat domain-containing protein [Halodesulfurarchaeum sp. HSR-GB]|uniref:HEAT repeat domain-containing protein n=1 Tax=Halodesulfurarchaeum sp. HSR-GB TaxID=3074077 RepID=UPI00285764E6|nr:HEAT repeat domain-containing protein [Halodesulfurarchaeum sp. HSR-GB]MDR5656989.1 HEAT repeat domain-containing protein [Halodesulfurarchaeum sp. HSR-GB]
MSDGDEEPAETEADSIVSEFEERLESASQAVEAAETEADLDEVEATLEAIGADLEDADIPVPEPEDEDEEPTDPAEELEDELSDLEDAVADKRGPYGEDVIEAIGDVQSTITDTRWAEEGENELVPGVQDFLDTTAEILDADFGEAVPDPEELSVTLGTVTDAVADAEYDADEDAETIASLLDATDTLASAVDSSTAWTDLEIRERLDREGFYEPLEGAKHKDFPPEWSALKTWQQRGNVEMVVLLLDLMGDTDYITRHCIEALEYMGDEAGVDALTDLANRRNLNAIDAIGKIGAESGVSAVEGHAESGRTPELQARAITALGAIGDESTTGTVADQLLADSERVRTAATRALGMIGDTRAIDPLADVLEDTDEENSVRASAAWALCQIGTEAALSAAAEYADASSYLIEAEAAKAADALGLEDEDDSEDPDDTEQAAAEDEESDEAAA